MIINGIRAGGLKTARLLYIAAAFIVFAPCLYALTVTGGVGSLSFNDIGGFSAVQTDSGTEFTFLYEGKTPDIPAGLELYLFAEGKGRILLKVPSKSGINLSFSDRSVKISWQESGSSPKGSVFDVREAPQYPLGPGDRLLVEVYQVEEISKEVVVDPAGFVTLPLLDRLKVQGYTINELQKVLEDKFGEFINNPQVNIQLKEYGSRFVNIIGEVMQSRRIPLKTAFRLLDALSEAGGFTEKSGDIEIQRRDKGGILQKIVISKDALLSAGEGNENIFVFDQDTVNVLPVNSVYVSGEVRSAKSLTYTRDMTLLRAIAMTGGFTEWAKKDKVVILRKSSTGETQTIKADAGRIEKGKDEDIPLMPNDHVIVDERKLF